MVAAGAGNILSHNGGVMVAAGAGNIKAESGAPMVAAGAGNMVAAGAGNIVAAGGGDIVAAGSLNRPSTLDVIAARMAMAKASYAQARAAAAEQEISPETWRAALMRSYSQVNADTNIGIITAEAGGNVTALNGGAIVADSGGILKGAGTFNGPGQIKSGGAVMPGSSAGTLTWNGNVTFDSGSLLDIEIGGTSAGTQYDVLNANGTCTLNGAINVRLLGNFGSAVLGSDVFDVVTASSAIVTNLAGSRVAAAGSYGTFEVQLVNSGKTLRLANYQAGPATFNSWANKYGLSGANAAWNADPNNNGVVNLLEYALGLDPTAVGGSRGTSVGTVTSGNQKFLSLSYTKPTGADAPTDITYTPELATSVTTPNWSSSSVDIVPFSTTPGPGSLETVTVRSTHPIGTNGKEFLRLKVDLLP
jgi:hypothetical protein